MERNVQADPGSLSVSLLCLAELLDGFRCADPVASAELARRFQPALRRHARRRLAQRGMAGLYTLDDLVQDAWLQLCTSLLRPRVFPNEAAFTEFLRRIVDRLVSHRQRAGHAAKRAEHAPEPLDGMSPKLASKEVGPAQTAALADQLRHELARLPRKQAACMEALLCGEGLTHIAARLRIHERTARRWLEAFQKTLTGQREREACKRD